MAIERLVMRPLYSRLVIARNAEVGTSVVAFLIGGAVAVVFRPLGGLPLAGGASIAIGRRRFRLGLGALQQRIALDLGLHERAQLDVGQLQQSDSLLQLGGHHQLLALSQLQFRHKRHDGPNRREDVSRGQGIRSPH